MPREECPLGLFAFGMTPPALRSEKRPQRRTQLKPLIDRLPCNGSAQMRICASTMPKLVTRWSRPWWHVSLGRGGGEAENRAAPTARTAGTAQRYRAAVFAYCRLDPSGNAVLPSETAFSPRARAFAASRSACARQSFISFSWITSASFTSCGVRPAFSSSTTSYNRRLRTSSRVSQAAPRRRLVSGFPYSKPPSGTGTVPFFSQTGRGDRCRIEKWSECLQRPTMVRLRSPNASEAAEKEGTRTGQRYDDERESAK